MRRCSCVIRTGVYNRTREGGCICQGQLEFSKVNERGAFQVVAEQYRGMVFRVPEYHSASRNTILRPGIPFRVTRRQFETHPRAFVLLKTSVRYTVRKFTTLPARDSDGCLQHDKGTSVHLSRSTRVCGKGNVCSSKST